MLTDAVQGSERGGRVRRSVSLLLPHLVDDFLGDGDHHSGRGRVAQPHRQEPRRQHEPDQYSTHRSLMSGLLCNTANPRPSWLQTQCTLAASCHDHLNVLLDCKR